MKIKLCAVIVVFLFLLVCTLLPALATSPDMVLLDGGKFKMGSKNGEDNEKPQHKVKLDPFYMGKYEVTNEEYCEFMNAVKDLKYDFTLLRWEKDQCGITFDEEKGLYVVKEGQEKHPVIWVTWYGAAAYCNWLSQVEGLGECYMNNFADFDFTKNGYRLPTEAEWEYACRGGSESAYFWGSSMDDNGNDYCWYSDNSERIHDVGQKMANSFGLYDMAGGVWEWCNDWYSANEENPYKDDKNGYYKHKDAEGPNPTGPATGEKKSVRGGSWGTNDFFCRSAFRNSMAPADSCYLMGFRVVRNK